MVREMNRVAPFALRIEANALRGCEICGLCFERTSGEETFHAKVAEHRCSGFGEGTFSMRLS
jgi:hypothetical protein